jgi:VIT1/CCC1 family predicted Fe2+/Mn2+ transporter
VTNKLVRPAVFGLSDGMMSLLGVVLFLLGHQSLIFPAALSGGISSALSMAGGEWLSDSDSGLGASCVMGAATGVGAVLPALPYALATGPVALCCSVVICLGIGVAVALMRPNRRPARALAETGAVLAVIFAAVLVCGLFLPGSAS